MTHQNRNVIVDYLTFSPAVEMLTAGNASYSLLKILTLVSLFHSADLVLCVWMLLINLGVQCLVIASYQLFFHSYIV